MDVREMLELVENTVPMSEQMTEFVDGYISAMLWVNTIDADGESVDSLGRADELTVAALTRIVEDAHAFLFMDVPDDFQSEAVENVFDLIGSLPYAAARTDDASLYDLAGHDFALTRNRHGAGFWDRGLGEAGDVLTDLAHSFGEATLFASADAITHG